MPLWKNLDNISGNGKPLYANASNSYSNSTINGGIANTNAGYGYVMGVSPGEAANSNVKVQHAGWNSLKIGTGPIASVKINNAGAMYNSGNYLTIVDASWLKKGANANISYTIANSQNTMQAFSTNPTWNVINAVTIVTSGDGFSNVSGVTLTANGSNSTPATFDVKLGGRAGRIQVETLIALGSMLGDDPSDNIFYPGV